MKWEDSYVGKIRTVVGNQKLIIPSIRAIIEDSEGKILFIERKGEGKWGMPAGSIELDESIYDCLVREVKEETGLNVEFAHVVALYTNPNYKMKNSFGDEYQLFETLFWVERWTGNLKYKSDETSQVKFFPNDHIPEGTNYFWTSFHHKVIEDFKQFKLHQRLIID
ncbi:NUDIX domain-containing protein [Bacillus pinisoli]|uniref:NUDIX domain-containing protein n=1 Tax=Bacillus pinisoli TaxID=2901866 RepID=UPI001FF59089|nr:NUDIX domain-containing protein [Bacillus pinisoli]